MSVKTDKAVAPRNRIVLFIAQSLAIGPICAVAIKPLAPTAVLAQIHASRCVRFDGPLLPILLRQANVGWNSSLLEYCWDALRDHQQGLDSGAKALTVFSQMFLTRKGFDQDLIAALGR